MIQTNRLEGFYRVAKAGGYARAVKDFPYPITEPAVHQQVKKLEEELGQKLLYRIGKDRMGLTPAGRHLYEFAAPFFEKLPEVVAQIAGGSFARTLRIDAGPQEIRELIPRWVRQIQKAEPDVRIELQEVQFADVSRLRTGQADVMIEYLPDPPADIAQKVVSRAYAMLVVPADLAHKGKVQIETLRELPFIGFNPTSREHALQLQGLELFRLRPPRLLNASTVEAILGFVQAGLGYSFIPWQNEHGPKLAGVVAQRLRTKGATFPICASWLKRSDQNPMLRTALSALPR